MELLVSIADGFLEAARGLTDLSEAEQCCAFSNLCQGLIDSGCRLRDTLGDQLKAAFFPNSHRSAEQAAKDLFAILLESKALGEAEPERGVEWLRRLVEVYGSVSSKHQAVATLDEFHKRDREAWDRKHQEEHEARLAEAARRKALPPRPRTDIPKEGIADPTRRPVKGSDPKTGHPLYGGDGEFVISDPDGLKGQPPPV